MSLTFHPFSSWCALALDGEPLGYMSHREGKTTLHLRNDALRWLCDVRAAGPWASNAACQAAVKAAMPAELFTERCFNETDRLPLSRGPNVVRLRVDR
jgi:hypothetical protein